MLAFLKANVYNIIVIAILLLVVFLIIRKIVKDKKAGKSAVCGGDCSKCHANCSHKNWPLNNCLEFFVWLEKQQAKELQLQ